MYSFLLVAARTCLVAFLLGGTAVTLGQLTAIALGDGAMMEVFGTGVADTACVTASVAGTVAFLLRYTAGGDDTEEG
ncbi:hypothetical protein [Amycolatopsis magusensis]|uniref:hypothetical protein n=1 Tax=Amycolatopsis magusensis TaxID=882444 RepID=UPI00379BF35D